MDLLLPGDMIYYMSQAERGYARLCVEEMA